MGMAEGVGCFTRVATACCCLSIRESKDVSEFMVQQTTTEPEGPSLYSRLCWCQWAPLDRKRSGLEKVEPVRGLAGITLQAREGGDHETEGSLETLKWGTYDESTRSMTMMPFGGFWQQYTTGLWTEPAGSALWFV